MINLLIFISLIIILLIMILFKEDILKYTISQLYKNDSSVASSSVSSSIIHDNITIDSEILIKNYKKITVKELKKLNVKQIYIEKPWNIKDNWFVVINNKYYIPEGLFMVPDDAIFNIEGIPKKSIYIKI